MVEVARESGTTSRTLRHYDAIGLLRPARRSDGGLRWYGQAELLRLQQVLLLRGLGLGLGAVAEVLERQSRTSTVEVLARHREQLRREQARLSRLVATVERTITSIEEGQDMAPQQVFEGFEHDPYEAETRERYGDEVVDASQDRVRGWSAGDAEQARTGYARVHEGLARLRDENAPVDDPRVQELVREHHGTTCLFWTPDRDAYRGLAQTYVDDERFRQSIGGGDDALVEYLRDAMGVYADTRLTGA